MRLLNVIRSILDSTQITLISISMVTEGKGYHRSNNKKRKGKTEIKEIFDKDFVPSTERRKSQR